MANGVPTGAEARLSAVRAFIGVIRPSYRRVGVKVVGDKIQVSVILDETIGDTLEDVIEDVSIAGADIIADFLEPMTISEEVQVLSGDLPSAHIIDDGLIYQRWEPRDGGR